MIYDNLIVNKPLGGTLFSKSTGEVLFSVTDIANVTFTFSGEQQSAVNSDGVKIATFNRSKGVKFSAESARINLSLLASQLGTTKKVASSGSKIVVPAVETYTIGGEPNTTIVLEHVPVGTAGAEIPYIYKIEPSGGIVETYSVDEEADATHFAISAATKTITLPVGAGLTATDQIRVWYSYESDDAVEIDNNATDFPLGGSFWLEGLYADYCDPNTLFHGFVVFGNVALDPNFAINLKVDGNHPFGFEALVDNCDPTKRLCYFVLAQ